MLVSGLPPVVLVLNVCNTEIKLLVRTGRTGGANSSISFHCYLLLKCLYFPPAEREGKIQTDLRSTGFKLISHLNSQFCVCQKSFHLKVQLALLGVLLFWLIINFSDKNRKTTSSFLKLFF